MGPARSLCQGVGKQLGNAPHGQRRRLGFGGVYARRVTLPPQPDQKPARPKHPARLIWKIVAGLDLSACEKEVASFEREVGRSRWSPQLLTSILTYDYTLGTGSARELERLMASDPGLRWLGAMEVVNHHTLSDFRVREMERLQGILTQVLALLANENLVDLVVWGLDRFRLRGVVKANQEAFWMVLAFTMDRWLLLRRQATSARGSLGDPARDFLLPSLFLTARTPFYR